MVQASPSWCRFEKQAVRWALILALLRIGSKSAAKIAIVAMTASNSTRVKPRRRPDRPAVIVLIPQAQREYNFTLLGLARAIFTPLLPPQPSAGMKHQKG